MTVTFYSNFMSHHQIPFCLEMEKRYGKDFTFVSTIKIPEERIKLGYKNLDDDFKFVLKAYENKEKYSEAVRLGLESDIVIMGTASDEYIEERLRQDKLTFRYCERTLRDGIKTIFNKEKREKNITRHVKYKKNKNTYALCASAYGKDDFDKMGIYKDKVYKWGYFPEMKTYDIDELISKKEDNSPITILWVARYIECKHPEHMIKLASKLKKDGYNFKIIMVGNGELYNKTKKQIIKQKLEKEIELVGGVDSEKVREYMEQANIFTFTSDKRDGWGAVLNESMNSGCAVVSNIEIGGTPYLIKHNENGIIYRNLSELYKQVEELIDNKELRMRLGKNAYKTIKDTWNSKNATENLIKLFDSILNNKENEVVEGPASKA